MLLKHVFGNRILNIFLKYLCFKSQRFSKIFKKIFAIFTQNIYILQTRECSSITLYMHVGTLLVILGNTREKLLSISHIFNGQIIKVLDSDRREVDRLMYFFSLIFFSYCKNYLLIFLKMFL